MTLLKIKGRDIIPDSFERLVNDLLSDAKTKSMEESGELPTFYPLTNLIESDERYQIQLALPGWDKKEIQLSLDNGILSVKGSKDDPKQEKYSWNRREFSYGKFEKRFQIPKEAKDTVNAELKNGILYIVIEKAQKEETKKIIQVL